MVQITERIGKNHKYDRGSLKVLLDGRDVTAIALSADPSEGWVELGFLIPPPNNATIQLHSWLVNGGGKVSAKMYGKVEITGEVREASLSH